MSARGTPAASHAASPAILGVRPSPKEAISGSLEKRGDPPDVPEVMGSVSNLRHRASARARPIFVGEERVGTFSGGMKRRVNIAAGLLHRPEVLFLDEPTVGVDPQSRTFILDGIARLADGGLTVVYSTHYMEEAERICRRVAIVDHGR